MMRSPAVLLPLGGLLTLAVALFVAALRQYPGSGAVFALFGLSYLLLITLIFPRPRLYVYTFLAAFLFLGFWVKAVAQSLWSLGIMEAVGDFAGMPLEWDRSLLSASWGALGAAAARAAYLWLHRLVHWRECLQGAAGVPGWYRRWRNPVWVLTLALVAAVNAANYHFAIQQVGVNPRLILPLHLNVFLAWLINIGFALGIAVLVFWEYRIDERSLARSLLAPIAEAFLSSATALSRLAFLLHAVPYALAIWENWKEMGRSVSRRTLLWLATCFALLVCVSVLLVFVSRILQFHEADFKNYSEVTAERSAAADQVSRHETLALYLGEVLARQLPPLFIQRWVGLEGVLTVGAVRGRGKGTFLAAVAEDPRRGADSLYQRHARPSYLAAEPHKFTFLSNAGVVAVLFFSDSLIIVFSGMILVTGLALLTERFAEYLTANPLFLAVAGAGLANVICQMTFPYLALIFLLQLWVAIGFIAIVQRIDGPGTLSRAWDARRHA